MEKSVYEFISKQSHDPIVERRTCKASGKEFAIFQSDVDFYNKISPTFAGQKFQIPLPTLCPEERQRRRIVFRNFNKLYKQKCDGTGKQIITMYQKPYTIYNNALRRSDNRDPMSYGMDFDLSKTFTEQYKELLLKVPKYATHNLNCENSIYSNMAANSKNCYLIFGCINNEDCAYGHILRYSQDSYDVTYSKILQNCYQCIDCYQCTNCRFSQDCENCADSWFIKNCNSCSFCLGCIGLVNKKYCIFNEQYTQEEYDKKVKSMNLGDYSDLQKVQQQCVTFQQGNPHEATHNFNSHQCIGNNITNSDKVICSFDVIESENVKYGYTLGKFENSQDVTYSGVGSSFSYETLFCGGSKIYFSSHCQDSARDIFYCDDCYQSSDCFGCAGLRGKQHCIFNKQYSQQDYEKLFVKIIQHMQETGEWGEFFHASLSPFAYNETVAQEYFPMTKDEILSKGYRWQQEETSTHVMEKIVKANELPNNINDVADDILQAVIQCEISGKLFRITKSELDFYRRHGIPLPHLHPDVRHTQRMQQRPGRELYLRKCDKTDKEILSVYPSNAPFKVYSEEAYNKEIYG